MKMTIALKILFLTFACAPQYFITTFFFHSTSLKNVEKTLRLGG